MNEVSQQRFADLRARYQSSLPEKHATVERAWRALLDSPDEHGALALQSIAHRLAGSAAPYGYDAIGSAAHVLDAIISDWQKRGASERESASALAARLATPASALVERLAHAIEALRDSA